MRAHLAFLRDTVSALRHIWRETSGFFLSIELWMMVALSWALVAACWLAFIGDLRSVAVFVGLSVYVGVRCVLHVKRILHWPFI